jgi:hypothetical protein|tara:strand:- start:96 stop:359 length:264 start_codon:yes stop_codon:yes gene_type:complete
MVIKIKGYKRFGLPEDWQKSMTLDELKDHFNMLAKDAKEIHGLLDELVWGGHIDKVRDLSGRLFPKIDKDWKKDDDDAVGIILVEGE